MEHRGVLIDKKILNKQSKQISKRLQQLEQAAYDEAGEEFNLGSPKQIQNIEEQDTIEIKGEEDGE